MESVDHKEPWQNIAARKRAALESKIPHEWRIPTHLLPDPSVDDVSSFPQTSGLFTQRELELIDVTASEVVSRIGSGEWTCEEVTRAICKRASVAQQLVNCLTEIVFDEAIARAKDLDESFKSAGPVGPLHGLPISLKDQFNVPGIDSTIGYIARVGKPATRYSTLVKSLLDAGAVVYVKTNVPATLMMGETVNNLFGRTLNPFNRKLSPSGSSGGESALIALRGSYLGVGTDIGGSIRHPCDFTSLFGLRPSHGRVSYRDAENTYIGQEAVKSCAGPMCRSPEDLKLFMTAVIMSKPWLLDPQCLPIAWRTPAESLPSKLCFGMGMSDGQVSATPPLRRALEIVRHKLIDAGHMVIDYTPHEMPEAREIIIQMWTADGGQEFQRDTDASGEPLHFQTEAWLGKSANAPRPSVSDTWQCQHRRTLLAQRWLERWEATVAATGTGRPIDGLIFPSLPFPAVRHDSNYPSHYASLSPLLDLTTGSFPVTWVDLEKDHVPSDFKPLSEQDQKVVEFYGSPQNHENSPVGLSLIGRRLEEEKVIAMLQLLAKIVPVDSP